MVTLIKDEKTCRLVRYSYLHEKDAALAMLYPGLTGYTSHTSTIDLPPKTADDPSNSDIFAQFGYVGWRND